MSYSQEVAWVWGEHLSICNTGDTIAQGVVCVQRNTAQPRERMESCYLPYMDRP